MADLWKRGGRTDFALVQAVKPKRALVLAPTFAEYAQALEAVG